SRLVQTNEVDIDLNDFSIADGGDERNYVAMAKLMLDEGRCVVAMLDGDGHGKKLKERLEKLAGKHVQDQTLTILLLPESCSIEDTLLAPQLYVDAVSKAVTELVRAGITSYENGFDEEKATQEIRQKLQAKPRDKTL